MSRLTLKDIEMKFKVVGDDYMVVPQTHMYGTGVSAPHVSLLDEFKWRPGANVQAIWRKYGWVPPTEYREDYLFKHNREET